MSIKVLVVDDNPVVRMGLWSLLALDDEVEVCGEAGSGPQALEVAAETDPDVVLLDVRMPGGGGLDVLPDLAARARVLMLTYSDEPAIVAQAVRSGATGFLVHGSFESRELVQAIKDTAAGAARLSPSAAAVLMAGLGTAAAGPSPGSAEPAQGPASRGPALSPEVVSRYRLSRRERELCTLLVEGASNGEIATALFIEEKTVKNHINRVFAKLAASNRSEAIAVLLGTKPPASRRV